MESNIYKVYTYFNPVKVFQALNGLTFFNIFLFWKTNWTCSTENSQTFVKN